MEVVDVVDDIPSVESLLMAHDERKKEIEAREEMFGTVIAQGEKMIESGHYSSEEISEKVELLLSERERLHECWTQCQTQFDQMYELAVFMKETKQLETIMNSQELVMAGAELGSMVDKVESLLKKHENLERLVLTQEEKIAALQELSENFASNGHFARDVLKKRVDALCEHHNRLQTLLVHRRRNLEDSKRLAKFYQDIVELNSWITEKLQTASDYSYKDPRNIETKLKKHAAFCAEVTVHQEIIDDVKTIGNALISNEHYAKDDIAQRLEYLDDRWQELLQTSSVKSQRLEEARELVKFKQKADSLEMMIKDKESVVSSDETGRDYEECLILNRKCAEFEQEVQVESQRIEELTTIANKLETFDHSDVKNVHVRQQMLRGRWERLKDQTVERKRKLAGVLQVFYFLKSCDELLDNIKEKGFLASVEDYGKDLQGVESLLRKHDELERNVIMLNESFEKIKEEGERLKKNETKNKNDLDLKITSMMEYFARVNQLVVNRRGLLEEHKLLHVFLSDYDNLISWLQDLLQHLKSDDLPQNMKATEKALGVNQERKRMIDAHQGQLNHCVELGNQLINNEHFAASEILKNVAKLQDLWSNVEVEWDCRKASLEQGHHLQKYLADVDQFERWIDTKESLVLNDDLGDSLPAVDELLKNHTNLMNSLLAYEEQATKLISTSESLLGTCSYDDKVIRKTTLIMNEKWKGLKASASDKQTRLEESKLLQQFLQDCSELKLWMYEKSQLANDTSYLERSNFQQILQKHNTLESELIANRRRVEDAVLQGKCLVQDKHFAFITVEKTIDDIQISWNKLNEKAKDRGRKLHQACEKRVFDWSVDDFSEWLSNLETALTSKDFGQDLNCVNALMKKQVLIEADVVAHKERLNEILRRVEEFQDSNHFQLDNIRQRADEVMERYNNLIEPAVHRSSQLQLSLSLHQFLRDVEDQLRWLQEKQRLAESDEVGNDLLGAETLMKKHEVLETEVKVHEKLVTSVSKAGEQLLSEEHYAADDIIKSDRTLKEAWTKMLRTLEERKKKLNDSLQVQKYYRNVFDAESWIEDKLYFARSDDFGQSKDSAELLLRSHDTLQLDVHGFQSNIHELKTLSQDMIENGHFEYDLIAQRQAKLEEKFEDLRQSVEARRQRLEDTVSWFRFSHETAELRDWMLDMAKVVDAEDCGLDLEHAQMLLNKFEDFARDLVSSEDRVVAINNIGQEMIEALHSQAEEIEQTILELCEDWDALKERASTKLKKLEDLRDLHSFKNNVDDTKSWLQEKQGILVYNDDFGKDYLSVKNLLKKHDELRRDVDAAATKMKNFRKEGITLGALIPTEKESLDKLLAEVNDILGQLFSSMASRQSNLEQSLQLQQFLNEHKNISSWIANMTAQVISVHHENDESELERLLSKLYELKTEIDTMRNNFKNLFTSGQSLLDKQHYALEIIEERIKELNHSWNMLITSWEDRTTELQKRKEAENMNRELSQLEAWLLHQEAELEMNEAGGSLENVEDLLKKHDEMERMLLAQEDRFLGLIQPSSLGDTHEYNIDSEALEDETLSYNVETGEEPDKGDKAYPVVDKTSKVKPDDSSIDFDTTSQEDRFSSSSSADEIISSAPTDIPPSNCQDTARTNDLSKLNSMPSAFIHDLLLGKQDHLLTKSNNRNTTKIDDLSAFDRISGLEDFDLPADEHYDGDLKNQSYPSDFLTNKNYEGIEVDNQPELPANNMLIFDVQVLNYCDEATEIKEFDKHPLPTSTKGTFEPNLENKPFNLKHSLYKEPMSTSEFILDVSPLHFGILRRKQETDSSGQRCVALPWRSYYTVLSEDELHFFKDLEGFKSKWPVSRPMSLAGAFCKQVSETSSQGFIFSVIFCDKSEYYFAAENEDERKLWVIKINSAIEMVARYNDDCIHEDKSNPSHKTKASNGTNEENVNNLVKDGKLMEQYEKHAVDKLYQVDAHSDTIENNESDGDRLQSDTDGDTLYGKNSTSDSPKDESLHPHSSGTPMILITDTNSSNEFLVEDQAISDVPLCVYSDEEPQFSDDDTVSLPEQSDYAQPSWYPKRTVGDQLNLSNTFSKLSTQYSDFSPKDVATDIRDQEINPLTHIFKAESTNEHDLPPPVPKTPPPCVSSTDAGLPPDLPKTLPPENPDENLLDLMDLIPPPVLDPSFDFLVETKDELMETKESAVPNETRMLPTIRPQSEIMSNPSSSSRFTTRRIAPPPPPPPSVSLLSDLDLPLSIQTARKEHAERKEEKKGLFGSIFKRKK